VDPDAAGRTTATSVRDVGAPRNKKRAPGYAVLVFFITPSPGIAVSGVADVLMATSVLILAVGLLARFRSARRALRREPTDELKAMIYTFDDVVIDVASRQIRRGATPVHATRKAFELLVLLVERRPEVVSKEEIHRHLWPATFVSESSIQVLVSELRHALDAGHARTAILTVHGVGYAFDAALTEVLQKPRSAAALRAWLLNETLRVPLYEGDNIVGRGREDGTTIDAPGISRRHVRIVVGEAISLEDLESKNGTWWRGQRVTSAVTLSDGDQIRIGPLSFTFREAHAADSTETQLG
jgi:DNA-binding winged helix-turn-helix (wHTH) protein